MITDEKTLHFVKERLYDRHQKLLLELKEHCKDNNGLPYPEWFNTHDYASGFWAADKESMNYEIRFLEGLINDIENATT